MKCVIHLNNGKGKKIHFNGNFPEEKKITLNRILLNETNMRQIFVFLSFLCLRVTTINCVDMDNYKCMQCT